MRGMFYQSHPVFHMMRSAALGAVMAAAASGNEERPSWPVVDAANRLLAERALVMPGRDGFVKQPNGRLVQYQLPSKRYVREGKTWRVDLISLRWRQEGDKGWMAWHDARPKYNTWRIGRIRVEVLSSGVNATWEEDNNFRGCTAPKEVEVTHRLTTSDTGVIPTPDDNPSPAGASADVPRKQVFPQQQGRHLHYEPPAGGGIFRRRADGSLEKVK